MSHGTRWKRSVILASLLLLPALAAAEAELPVLSLSDAEPTIEVAAHSEYVLDAANALRYGDVAQGRRPFRRHDRESFRFSFQKATIWIRCRIAPGSWGGKGHGGGPLLIFDNPSLGSITLYVPVVHSGVSGLIEMKGGWQEAARSHELPFLHPAFVLPGNIDPARPLLIHIVSSFGLFFRVTLHTPDSFRSSGFMQFFIIGACLGILGAMLLYNLVLYLYMRDRHYVIYILYVFFMLVWQGTLFGLFRYLAPPLGNWINLHVLIFASLMLLFGIIFAIVFLNTARTAPRHHAALKGLAACTLAVICVTLLGHNWIANLLAYFLAQVSSVAIFTSAIAALRSGFRPARYYLIAVSVVLAAALVFFLRFYGVLPNNMLTMHAVLYGSSAEAVLLSFALGHRIRLMRQEEETLRLREKSLQAISVTDDLTGLYNRRFFNASLEKSIAAASRSGAPLSLLMLDVDHFKNFNDAYGHPEGDEVLKALGRLLTQALRGEDVACRYGGEEFVIILHSADIRTAMETAERIRSQFERIPFQPNGSKAVTMTISIGATQWRPGEDPEPALLRADQALYQAKHTGRNRVCRK